MKAVYGLRNPRANEDFPGSLRLCTFGLANFPVFETPARHNFSTLRKNTSIMCQKEKVG
jgi:hypothetical protein